MKVFSTLERQVLYEFLEKDFRLSQVEFEYILKFVKKKEYKKGDYILNHRDLDFNACFLMKGMVHHYVVFEGETMTVDLSLPGMNFKNYFTSVDNNKSEYMHRALTDLLLLYIEKRDLYGLLMSSKIFSCIHAKMHEHFNLEREKRAFILQNKSAFRKFELFISTMTNAEMLIKEVPQKLIASLLGLTPETYSRVKKTYFKANSIS